MDETKIISVDDTIVIQTEKTKITSNREVIFVTAPNINLESDK